MAGSTYLGHAKPGDPFYNDKATYIVLGRGGQTSKSLGVQLKPEEKAPAVLAEVAKITFGGPESGKVRLKALKIVVSWVYDRLGLGSVDWKA